MKWQAIAKRVIIIQLIVFIGLSLASSIQLMADDRNPLAGHIWDASQCSFVKFEDMLNTISGNTYIILGERHGCKVYQGREAFLIGTLAEAGRYPRITL